MKNRFFKKFNNKVINQFLAGLIVILPLYLSFIVIKFLLNMFDSILAPILKGFGMNIPGLGVLLLLFLIWLIGLLATNFFGRQIVKSYESIIARVPIISSIFGAVKQLSDNLFSGQHKTFKQVVLINSPFLGMKCIGFLPSTEPSSLRTSSKKLKVLHVFIPFTPPTSGFIVLVPEKEIIPLDMTVEEGLKIAVSIGVIHPKTYFYKKMKSAGKNGRK